MRPTKSTSRALYLKASSVGCTASQLYFSKTFLNSTGSRDLAVCILPLWRPSLRNDFLEVGRKHTYGPAWQMIFLKSEENEHTNQRSAKLSNSGIREVVPIIVKRCLATIYSFQSVSAHLEAVPGQVWAALAERQRLVNETHSLEWICTIRQGHQKGRTRLKWKQNLWRRKLANSTSLRSQPTDLLFVSHNCACSLP